MRVTKSTILRCRVPCDHVTHIPERSYALYQAREVLFGLINEHDQSMVIHPEARTTPKIRAEIKASTDLSQRTLTEKYNVSEQTIRKWQKRDKTTDKSHRPDHSRLNKIRNWNLVSRHINTTN